jgi:23S rRNA (cytosine1962-C5)-methyltransferase
MLHAVKATAVVSARGIARIRAGHPWIFRDDVSRGPERDAGDGGPFLVDVTDLRGRFLGRAMWAKAARIGLRMLGNIGDGDGGADGDAQDGGLDALLEMAERRLEAALRRRVAARYDRDAYRVVHAEADGLPGLIIDRYGDAAVMQTTSVAMNAARAALAPRVAERLGVRQVLARDDGSARDFEGLPRFAGVVAGAGDTRVTYRLGPNTFEADLLTDGKTGGFLDQADNHALVAALAPEGARALDAFTYHGGFALALARRGGTVLATDESAPAVARARANAARNALDRLEVRQANAFDLLRTLESEGTRFDVVVVDPPALAKRGGSTGRAAEAALAAADRAYKELFLRGARLTAPGGLLVACSCSGRITRGHFEELITGALADAGRTAHILARNGAGRDHPELAGVPETGHLKCWVLRVF